MRYILSTTINKGILCLMMLITTLTLSTGCTHNNGYIGDWFGTWRLEEITVDGRPDPDYPRPAMIWKFQNSVMQMLMPNDYTHQDNTSTGTWHTADGYLYIDYSWQQGPDFTPLIHLTTQCRLKILHLSGSSIHLEYTSPDNKTYFYRFKKWD